MAQPQRALTVVGNGGETAVAELSDWSRAQIDLIKAHIAPGIDDGNLAFFGAVCKRTGLDPILKQIYIIGRRAKLADGTWGQRWTVQTGIDGYRLLAAKTHQLAGIDDATYDDEDAEHPGKATVTVWRFVAGQRVPFTATARWGEYVQTKDEYQNDKKTGNKVPTDMWQKMPYLMLAKCAEALALRKAFPAELSGVYTGEEMAQADNEFTAPGQVSQPVPPASAFEPRAKQRVVVTREMVAKLANTLQVAPADRKKLMEKHGGDFAAVYHELTQWAAAAEAEAQAASPEVSFEIVEEAHAADGNDLHGAFGPLVP